ncbi:MAG: DsbA family protein [Actinomycetota bacterium]
MKGGAVSAVGTEKAVVRVDYFTDPSCSWAWGTEPKIRKIEWEFGGLLAWTYRVGGLFHDVDLACPTHEELLRAGEHLGRYWEAIAIETGMPTETRLRRATVSTHPAGIAFKAAQIQGEKVALRFLRRLREGFLAEGKNLDDPDSILNQARTVPGLDVDRLARDMEGEQARAAFQEDWEATRNPLREVVDFPHEDRPGTGRPRMVDGRLRYVFPTMIFQGEGGRRPVAGWNPYEAYLEAIEAVAPGIGTRRGQPPTVDELLREYARVATKEVEIVCEIPRDRAIEVLEALEAKGSVARVPAGTDCFWDWIGA